MKRILCFSLVAGLALTAAACGKINTDGTFTPPVIISQSTDDSTVQAIRDGVQKTCGVLVEVGSVAAVVATFTGGGGIASLVNQAVSGLCSVLNAKGVRRGARAPIYRGVVIRYQRL